MPPLSLLAGNKEKNPDIDIAAFSDDNIWSCQSDLALISLDSKLSCWFSVSPAMLTGKKGKNLVSKMPLSKILTETDAPFTEKRGVPYMPWEAFDIVDTLKDIFHLDVDQIKNQLLLNAYQMKNGKKS